MLVDGDIAIIDEAAAAAAAGFVHYGKGRATRRRRRSEIAKQSSHYQMRNRIPKVDIEENPFCIERRLADAAEQIKVNKNPNRFQTTSAEATRSTAFVQNKNKFNDDLQKFKSRVVVQTLKDLHLSDQGDNDDAPSASTSMQKTLNLPDVKERGYMFSMSDAGVVMSFGQKAHEGSRTFNPIPMRADSTLHPHRDAKKKAGLMSSTMLYNLLHPSSSSSTTTQSSTPARRKGPALVKAEGGEPQVDGEGEGEGVESAGINPFMRMTSMMPIQTLTPENLYDPDDDAGAGVDHLSSHQSNDDASEPSIQQIRESQWNNDYRCTKKYFSFIPSLLSGAEYSSVEKFTRFKKKASGTNVPELFRGRHERDMEYLRETSESFFPREIESGRPLTPRTYECNQQIKYIMAKEKNRQAKLQAKVMQHQNLVQYDRMPKLSPLTIT